MTVPLVRSPRELAAHLATLAPTDPAALALDLRTAFEPRIYYPLGSAQADVVAVVAGLKPMLRSTLSHDEARRTLERYRHLGLHGLITDEDPDEPVRHGEARLYLGRDRPRILAAARADAAKEDRELGQLLGYPRCCVEAFLQAPRPHTAAAVLHAAFGSVRAPAPARLNCLDLHVFHYLPWFPCGPTCELSRRYADAAARLLPNLAPRVARLRDDVDVSGFIKDVDQALAAHRLHVFSGVQLSLTGELVGGTIHIASVWATAADRHHTVLPPDEQEATARLFHCVKPGCTVGVSRQTLIIDGRLIARAPHLFLALFDPTSGHA